MKVIEKLNVYKGLIKGLTCICLLAFLAACSNSNAIIGVWKPIEEQCGYSDVKEITFTKENEVQFLSEDDQVLAGTYQKNSDNIYSVNVHNIAMTANLLTSEGQETLDLVGGGDGTERCTYSKED